MFKRVCIILAVAAVPMMAATTFTGRIAVVPNWDHQKTTGSSTLSETFSSLFTMVHTTGTNANQMTTVTVHSGTLTNAQQAVIDLTNSVNGFGDTVSFDEVRVMAVSAGTANVGNLEVGNDATAPFWSWAGTNTASLSVAPGGFALLVAPGAAGYPVGTNSNIRVANTGTNTVTYTIYIGGAE